MNFVFTGGGTAGHVTPNIALIPLMQNKGYTVNYQCYGYDQVVIEMLFKEIVKKYSQYGRRQYTENNLAP